MYFLLNAKKHVGSHEKTPPFGHQNKSDRYDKQTKPENLVALKS